MKLDLAIANDAGCNAANCISLVVDDRLVLSLQNEVVAN